MRSTLTSWRAAAFAAGFLQGLRATPNRRVEKYFADIWPPPKSSKRWRSCERGGNSFDLSEALQQQAVVTVLKLAGVELQQNVVNIEDD